MNRNFEINWQNPPRAFRPKPIIHEWDKEALLRMDAIVDYGFGGAVTNPSHAHMYGGYRDACRAFGQIAEELKKRGLGYWIYDESGYPSGYAGGETLKGHPELEAKGFYMRRFVSYEESTPIRFTLDEQSDKIIWAAKYPMEISTLHNSFVQYDRMQAVPFTVNKAETVLSKGEAFYVFCVKSAYEGSQCTHNTCSFSRYINIMDPKAVRRFIDLMLEPIAEEAPGALENAEAVFTDEPSLMVAYSRAYEVWPYALAPWVDGLFEEYENKYGTPLQPLLPLLFEGEKAGTQTRERFYELVGDLIARAYSAQIEAWCKAHGTRLSGHYMGEERINGHVKYYGSYLKVLGEAGYPGLDVLNCIPGSFEYGTVKFPRIAARKMRADGMMVELCPFDRIEEFEKAPFENAVGMLGILYLCGVRKVNSYYRADYSEYDSRLPRAKGKTMNRDEARQFNAYAGRMGVMLDGMSLKTDTFVYYGYEDVCAHFTPKNTAFGSEHFDCDLSIKRILKGLMESGRDVLFADKEDLIRAAKTGEIGGNPVKSLIIPAMDIIDEDTLAAIGKLEENDTCVYFTEKLPAGVGGFKPMSVTDLCEALPAAPFEAQGAFLTARFTDTEKEVWMLASVERRPLGVKTNLHGTLYDPYTGKKTAAKDGFTIPPLRALFFVNDDN